MTKLAVLESRWHENENLTVRPMFDLLRSIRGGERTHFIYERFLGSKSFDEALAYYQQRGDINRMYIASHGCRKSLGPEHMGDSGITWQRIRDGLSKKGGTAQINGLYLATCDFGHASTLIKLLNDTPSLTWAAGYSESVDWEESYALDLLFFRKLLHSKSNTEIDKVRLASKQVRDLCPGLIEKLGFNVVWRTTDGLVEIAS